MAHTARVNQLELRLVQDGPELAAAQELRYRVFYEEMGAVAAPAERASRRDADRFDGLADHLVVVDLERSAGHRPFVVGCYRVLREAVVVTGRDGFYTAQEFDLDGLRVPAGDVIELGRSCVAPAYRNGTVMQLLWRGIAEYIERHAVGLMLGCVSLPGIDTEAAAPVLGYLHHHHLAPEGLRPRARPDRRVPPTGWPREAIDLRAALRGMPPLLKAYLRMGGMIGDGAVLDRPFNAIDVCLVLPTGQVMAHYRRHYSQSPRPRTAAAAA